MRTALVVVSLFLLPLAACKKEAASGGNAAGEILPGSASDAMLPEDRVTSHPPLDPGAVRVRATGAAEAEATGAAEQPAAKPEAEATAAAD